MEYQDDTILKAFQLYAGLASKGEIAKVDCTAYFEDEHVRSLVDNYASAVQCTLVSDADYLYLIPISMDSPFHMSNDSIKKEYMTAKSVNMDIYLMYLAIIVLFGCFYDSYESTEPLQFVTMQHWMENMDLRMESLNRHGEDVLKAKEGETYSGETLAGLKSEINSLKVGSDATVGALAKRVTTAEGKITALEDKVGDDTKGLVKNV